MTEGGFGPVEGCKRQISIRPFKRSKSHQSRPSINEMAAFQSLASSNPSKYEMDGRVSKFGNKAPQAWLLNVQYRYTHNDTHKFKAKLPKSPRHPMTHQPTHLHIHSVTDFGAIFVIDGGRIWTHGGLQTTDLDDTFLLRQVSSKSAQY